MVSENERRRFAPGALRQLICCCALLACATVGCRSSQQGGIPNPFLTADRVPAPATRLPAQGMAQPYYPSDAIPPFSGAQPAIQPLGRLSPSPDITPIPGNGNLASNEPAVKIPGDEGLMRFAARPTIAPDGVPASAGEGNGNGLVANRNAPTQIAPLRPARHGGSMTEAGTPRVVLTPVANNGAASGLFREPRGRAQAPALIQKTRSPRIRFPQSGTRYQEQVVAPGSVETMSYQVPIDPVQPAPPGISPTPSSDGFRARRSARSIWDRNPATPAMATLRVTPG